ncbi:MAG TPA: acyl carrier protein [Actinophytocola sp.]|uniref:acyl carrier protein n=1 Tax=Actinophytocola sp. TaxID=1872138 RepID=UPI002DB7E329|nr:acyl carrier protein [Actinophytocola sp.]HEU5473632.1 acyl carrier protein [Actinophytocola sp.]
MNIDILIAALRQVAGDDDAIDLAAAVDSDTSFGDIGFDSIALLEVLNLLKREHGVRLDDDVLEYARTPATLLDAIQKGRQDAA